MPLKDVMGLSCRGRRLSNKERLWQGQRIDAAVGDRGADHTILGSQEPKEGILGGRAGSIALQLEVDCGSDGDTSRGQETHLCLALLRKKQQLVLKALQAY